VDLVQDLETKEVDRFADKSRKETKDAIAFLIKRVQLFWGRSQTRDSNKINSMIKLARFKKHKQ